MRSWTVVGIVIAMGCGGSEQEPAVAPNEPVAQGTPPAAEPEPPATPRVEVESYVLDLSADEAGYQAGQAGAVHVRLVPRNGWHVNQDFPVAITLEAPSEVGLAKTQLARADAAAFSEQEFRFDVALTPTAAGTRELRADVRFAICTDENCLPQSARLALPVVVR